LYDNYRLTAALIPVNCLPESRFYEVFHVFFCLNQYLDHHIISCRWWHWGPLATVCTAALPRLAADLNASTGDVAATLSFYLAGFAWRAVLCLGRLLWQQAHHELPAFLYLPRQVLAVRATDVDSLMLFSLFGRRWGGQLAGAWGAPRWRYLHATTSRRSWPFWASIMALAPAWLPIGGVWLHLDGLDFLRLLAGSAWHDGHCCYWHTRAMRPEYRSHWRAASLPKNYPPDWQRCQFSGLYLTNSLMYSSCFAFISGSSRTHSTFLGVSHKFRAPIFFALWWPLHSRQPAWRLRWAIACCRSNFAAWY